MCAFYNVGSLGAVTPLCPCTVAPRALIAGMPPRLPTTLAPASAPCCPRPDPEVAGHRAGRCAYRAEQRLCGRWRNLCPVACGKCRRCAADEGRDLLNDLFTWRRSNAQCNNTGLESIAFRVASRAAAAGDETMVFNVLGNNERWRRCAARCHTGNPVARTPVELVWNGVPQSVTRVAAEPASTYVATKAILGGGINNMLMNIAQLLSFSCAAGATLLLPRLDADPLSGVDDTAVRVAGAGRRNASAPSSPFFGVSLAFGQVFDAVHFASHPSILPCRVAEDLEEMPSQATVEYVLPQPIRYDWNHSTMLHRVYAAIRPSDAVSRLVRKLTASAIELAGPRWAAVHLTIERDWWWKSGFCSPRRTEGLLRRCYSPAEVGAITAASRAGHGATGTVLLYAADKVSELGPAVCARDFGEANTLKLLLPTTIPYTIRNAAEQFLAASAPAAFYGNRFSTFSKGVAAMRALSSNGVASSRLTTSSPSYAYDCAAERSDALRTADSAGNRADKAPRKRLAAVISAAASGLAEVFEAHPGFRFLRPLDEGRCRRMALSR